MTAGVALPSIQLELLGIPPGFTPAEIQTWLRDLAGVAIETSRSDDRSRPIPPLLHHALTGLLFSQTELWSHTGHPLPCAAVFVEGPQGAAFGWVGRARVVLLVNGEPYEPQWVIVRDEAGQEAMSAALPIDSHVLLTLEYWPTDDGAAQAPASLDGEYGQSLAGAQERSARSEDVAAAAAPSKSRELARPVSSEATNVALRASATAREAAPPALHAPAAAGASTPAAPEPPSLPRVEPPSLPLMESLPTQQPGLAHDPSGMRLEGGESEQKLPSTKNPSSATFAMPRLPGTEAKEPDESEDAPRPGERRVSGVFDETEDAETDESDEPGHPVGRWLARLVSGFTRKRPEEEVRELSERDWGASAPSPPPPAPVREPAPPRAAAPPAPARSAPPQIRIEPAHLMGAPLPTADITEPHALRAEAGGPLRQPPTLPSPVAKGRGLAPAGLGEILGGVGHAPPAPGGTARSTPAAAEPASRGRRTGVQPPETGVGGGLPGTPYPELEMEPPAPAERAPIQIERESVGADSAFAIPKLPARETSRKAATPTSTGTRSTRRPGAGAAPEDPKRSAPKVSSRGPSAPPPVLTTPGAREGDVPEPPAEFLEQFAASIRVDPELEPAPPESPVRGSEAGKVTIEPPALQRSKPGMSEIQAPAATTPAVEPAAPAQPAARVAPPRAPDAPTAPGPPAARPSWPQPGRGTAGTRSAPPVLHVPSAAQPMPVAESEIGAMMRELPLPAPAAASRALPAEPMAEEIPEGMLLARPSTRRATGVTARTRGGGAGSRRGGQWPDMGELEERPRSLWPKVIGGALIVAALFGIGWLVGHTQAPDNDVHATPMTRLLRTFGIGAARFTATIDSDPPGAWIAVDGKDLGRQTPASLELLPGEHAIVLSMPDLGQVKTTARGKRDQTVKVFEALHGSLDVVAMDPSLPVQMSLDGAPQGYLPVHVAKLPPGLHELQFSGPRMQPWAQNVSVGIRKNTKVVSKPMVTPATGVVQVQAQMNDENGAAPLSGASVYVDGDLRGTTPSTMELPRGPHSLRVQFEGVVAPIQVIDLPGGNRRFAMFQFGLESDLPPLKLQGTYGNLLGRKPAVVSATLDGLEAEDLREAWLHVRTPEGLWSRYEITIEAGPRGAILTVNFPASQFNGEERANWYLSAATKQGDDFFTEMQRSGR